MDILQTTVTASVFILAVVVIRVAALHRLPKAAFTALWYIGALRLLVPVPIPFRFSVYTLLERLFRTDAGTPVTVPVPVTAAVAANTAQPVTAGTGAPVESAAHVPVWTVLWLAGVCVTGAFFVVAYVRYRRQFALSRPVEHDMADQWLAEHHTKRTIEIRQSDRVSAPLTYGVLRPAILLPGTMDWSDREKIDYILTHEYIHIRRFDALTKLILTAAVCVHWFNPLAWVMYVLANRDMELSCDEAVVRRMGESARTAYAMALIAMEETKLALSPLVSHFSKNAIEERIISIMKIKQKSIWSVILAALLVVSMATGLATTASAEKGAQTVYAVGDGLFQTVSTYETVSEAEFNDICASTEVSWWTYEEYAQQLEQDRERLQALAGTEMSYVDLDSPVYWSQELVDASIRYEEAVLDAIGDGLKLSQTVFIGRTARVLMIDPKGGELLGKITAMNPYSSHEAADRAPVVVWWTAEEYAQWLEQEKLELQEIIGGRSWTPSEGWFTWTQEKVDETIAMYEQILEDIKNGALISKTVDGSSDVMLASGTVIDSETAYSTRVAVAADESETVYADVIDSAILEMRRTQWEETLAPYASFGVTYEYDPLTDDFKLYWNGREVRGIRDETAGLWISEHAGISTYGEDAVEVYAVYENGELIGLRPATAEEQAAWTQIRADNTNSLAGDTMG